MAKREQYKWTEADELWLQKSKDVPTRLAKIKHEALEWLKAHGERPEDVHVSQCFNGDVLFFTKDGRCGGFPAV